MTFGVCEHPMINTALPSTTYLDQLSTERLSNQHHDEPSSFPCRFLPLERGYVALCGAITAPVLRSLLYLFCCLSGRLRYVRASWFHPGSPHITLLRNLSYKVACFCSNAQFWNTAESCIQETCAGSEIGDATNFIENICTVSSVSTGR